MKKLPSPSRCISSLLELGLSYRGIAEAVGISFSNVIKIHREQTSPRWQVADRLRELVEERVNETAKVLDTIRLQAPEK